MRSPSVQAFTFVTALLIPSVTQAQFSFGGPCSIYGPDYVAPQHPSNNSAVIKAIAAISKALNISYANSSFHDAEPYGIFDNATTFSIDLFSMYEEEPMYTYHYTAPAVAISKNGTNKVDSNSIYRLGSISKLLTVYTYLIAAGDTSWNEPITKYLPELANATQVDPSNRIDNVDWSEITAGALANQLAGLGRLHPLGLRSDALVALPGWPAPDEPAVSAQLCIAGDTPVPCNRTQFFESFLTRPPVVSAFETPIYSNDAYTILGYVLESITGKALPDLFSGGLTSPLGLTATTYYPPTTDVNGVVPVNDSVSGYSANIHSIIPVGGYYSNINEMRTIGKSILNSTLLSPALTRRWMKPHAFTADPRQLVGAPWELVRAPSTTTGKLAYLYTKLGDVGPYSSMVGYMPEYGVGFTILTAWISTAGMATRSNLGNMVVTELYPALEKAAKAEATANFAGTYKDAASNSSIVISGDQYTGLNISSWTQNGTDVRARFLIATRNAPAAYTRLIPIGLTNIDAATGETGEIAFRVIPSSKLMNDKSEPVSSICEAWVLTDSTMYGRYGLDSIVIEVDSNGRATAVVPKALGTKLSRVG